MGVDKTGFEGKRPCFPFAGKILYTNQVINSIRKDAQQELPNLRVQGSIEKDES